MSIKKHKYVRIIASTEINKIIFSCLDNDTSSLPPELESLCYDDVEFIHSYKLNGFLHIILHLTRPEYLSKMKQLASNVYLEEFNGVINLSKMVNISDDPKLQTLLIYDIMSNFTNKLSDRKDKIKIRELASKISSTSLNDPIYDALLEISRYIDGYIITNGRLYKRMSIWDAIQRIKDRYFKDDKGC